MRLTPFTIFEQLTGSMNRALEQYSRANTQLATGKKLLAPSDDVNAVSRAMDYRVNINNNNQYTRNVEFAAASLKVTSNTLSAVNSTVAEAKRLLILSQTGSADASIQSSMSQSAAILRDSLQSLSGSKYLGQYMFSGFISGQQPFTTTAPVATDPLTTINNTAAAAVSLATVVAPAALTGEEYRIGFDAAGANYTVYNNATNAVVTAATAYNPAGTAIALPGMSLTITGAVTAADSVTVRPPLSTYNYQGDAGTVNVQIDQGAQLAVNVIGSDAFSYTLAAPTTSQISGGRSVLYTPGAGTTINVQVFDTDNVTVIDSFSFSNIMDMTNLLSSAIGTNNTARMEALMEPFNQYQTALGTVQTTVGARQVRLNDQSTVLKQGTNTLQNALADIEDADMLETAAILTKTDTTLQALRQSASKVLSQSLLDFLQ